MYYVTILTAYILLYFSTRSIINSALSIDRFFHDNLNAINNFAACSLKAQLYLTKSRLC